MKLATSQAVELPVRDTMQRRCLCDYLPAVVGESSVGIAEFPDRPLGDLSDAQREFLPQPEADRLQQGRLDVTVGRQLRAFRRCSASR